MRYLQSPALMQKTGSIMESSGDLRLIMQTIYLDQSVLINASARTISKSDSIAKLTLFLTPSAKTLVKTVAVPNLVLMLTATAKTLSKAHSTVSSSNTTQYITSSARTVSHVKVILVRDTIAYRISKAKIQLIHNEINANLLV